MLIPLFMLRILLPPLPKQLMLLTLLQITLNKNILLYNLLFKPIILFHKFEYSRLAKSELLGDGGLGVLMSGELLGEFGNECVFLTRNLLTVVLKCSELLAHCCVELPV